MADAVPEDQAVSPAAPTEPPPLPAGVMHVLSLEPDRCGRCGYDLSGLPGNARFCPRCGRARERGTVSAAVQATVKAQVDAECEVIGHRARVVDWGQRRHVSALAGVFEPLGAGERIHSVILLGYASAMHTLGNRYEVGRGVYRNEREAVRCYVKAARLGNEDAAERLAGRGIATETMDGQ